MSRSDFRIHLSDEVLDDLHRRLNATRRPSVAVRPPWSDGVGESLMTELVEHWRDGFDWRARERALNRFRHRRCRIEGIDLHAMLTQADDPDPLPVLALHGWPSTFEQMTRLADVLSAAPQPVTLITPSLPGFGFSEIPTEPGWNPERMARAMHLLMTQHLGYERYLVRGTDYGIDVALHLGAAFPDEVAGVHVGGTHLPVPGDHLLPSDLTAEEHTFVADSRRWRREEAGYQEIQSTKPETLAYALSDSPVGLLAWIVEKYRTWCAHPDDILQSFSPDDLLSTATIYWATNTIASSMRLYREDALSGDAPRSRVPVAVNQPSGEEYPTPESWWRRLQPVVRFTHLPGAGHFPEWEAPNELAADLIAFRSDLAQGD